MRRAGTAIFAAFAAAGTAFADSDLLFLEVQLVGGWSTRERDAIWHSAGTHDAMQKNSVGFDYLRKFSGARGDWGAAALQFRLAWDDADGGVEAQLYNAFFKMKSAVGDFWAGHNRVAFGLSSYWDTHADLIGDLTMLGGAGFDRDWGAGWALDTEFGNVAATLTTGSGMGIRTYGNWLAGTRVGFGSLNYDNYNFGVSLIFGKTLDAMGYDVMSREPDDLAVLGWDAAFNVDAFEHKVEIDFGRKASEPYFAALYCFSVKLDDEERARLEFQPAFVAENRSEDWTLSAGTSWRLTSDVTLRFMYQFRHDGNDSRFVGQIYYYLPI